MLGLLSFTFLKTSAQTSKPAYWRYDAPGRLDHLEIVDINHDSVGEIIIVADDMTMVLVGADGRALWSSPFVSDEPIRQVSTVNVEGYEPDLKEIAVGTDTHLILLGSNGKELWKRPLRDVPTAIRSFRQQEGDPEDILVASQDGTLLRFNGQGQIAKEYDFSDSPADQASPNLEVADLNRDGIVEIIYSYLSDAGFSKLVVLDGNGGRRWERSNNGSIIKLLLVEFEETGNLEIAVATSLDRVYLYTADGNRRWPYRTPNKPITDLTMAWLEDGPALVIGTSAGTVIAYDQQGRRYWSYVYAKTPKQPIRSISAPQTAPSVTDPSTMAIILETDESTPSPADVILLDSGGQRLEPSFPGVDASGLSRLIDINNDGNGELLLAGFATLELVEPGIGARQYFEEWDYRLGAEPSSVLVDDIDLDGEQEIFVGTRDGKLHALAIDGTVLWVSDLGGTITGLTSARIGEELLPHIVVAHNIISGDEKNEQATKGWIELLRQDGRLVWSISLPTAISRITLGDINQSGPSELIVGTEDGSVTAYSLTGEEFWRSQVSGGIEHLQLIDNPRGNEIVVATQANTISRLNNKGSISSPIANFRERIISLDQIVLDERLITMLLVGLEDGELQSLGSRGNQNWATMLDGVPTTTETANNSLFVGTDNGELLQVDISGNILWRLPDIGLITSLYWSDLDGDVKPDIAVGNQSGEVRLMTADGSNTWDILDLASKVFHITAIQRSPDQQAKLVAITENGIVQLFRSEANRPPLLTNPQTEVGQGKYSISVSVNDVENDPVVVSLALFDPQSGTWNNLGEKKANRGNDTLFWSVNPPEDSTEVRYRFSFDDGTHKGELEPSAGPPPIQSGSIIPNILVGLFFAIVAAAGAGFYLYQSKSIPARVRRFFQRIKQQPEATLEQLESDFNQTRGSPDFLLNLANRARQESDATLASLADGLYLLTAQPESAIPVINAAIEDAVQSNASWRYLDEWKVTFKTGLSLLVAPSVTELSILAPQLELLIDYRQKARRRSESIEGLFPLLATLRDCERVDLAEDRLVYLNEAVGLLKQLEHQSHFWEPQIENVLVLGILDRWKGLINAEIEELHGRAQLVLNLLTQQLVPETETVVALSVRNTGRSPAEQIKIELSESPTYSYAHAAQYIPILSPGRERQVYFTIEPNVDDRFRIVFDLSYSDRLGSGKQVAFADMVHLLPPARHFTPIINPYSPGMPLKPKSTVFFGREGLFKFISQNTGNPARKTVLILVGQRRTGKTSALLQLEQHLPDSLLPIYIDCQSLGVTPGMPALFHDLAWNISDVLAAKGYQIPVPELDYWRTDPTGYFERQFLLDVRNVLPNGITILLIFDEFEVFENLVRDGILPPTLFGYFRHLMQHGDGLSFIFAGTHRLEEMGSDYWSVLFNTALYHHVGFLSDEAAKSLIRDPVAPNIIYDDLAIDKILRVTAGHPYFIQLVCYTLVNRANTERDGYVTISDVNATLDDMLRLGEVHFAYLWQRSTFPEKALLAAASRLMDIEPTLRPSGMVQFLEQFSIHLDAAEVTSGLRRLVEREIMREIAVEGTLLYELRIGLVGLWVAHNKSLSHLYESSGAVEASKYA